MDFWMIFFCWGWGEVGVDNLEIESKLLKADVVLSKINPSRVK
jgi:hypothetical protein